MIGNVQIKSYPCRNVSTGLRQRVATAHSNKMSAELQRMVVIICCTALFFVLGCSQFFHWAITQQQLEIIQMQSVHSALGTENISRLARRARLMSPEHIEAVAAVRLDLHSPVKGQVHRL